jgi:ACS family tartrate transporter-like MFS transporter
MWSAIADRNVLLLTMSYFCGATTQYGFSLWLPKIVEKASGFSPFYTTLITAIPYLAAWPVMLFVGAHSDRTGERRLHVAIPMAVSGLALIGTQLAGGSLVLSIAMFSLASMGINGRLPAFWPLPTAFLGGTSAAAAIGAINCIGNLGGFVGPYIVGKLTSITGTYVAGVAFLIGAAFVGSAATLLVRRPGAPARQ